MTYTSDKQNDGTYVIREENSRDILVSGVRGCNLNRTLNKMHMEDLYPTSSNAVGFKNGESYVVTESFITSVLNDHEVGGSWETGRVVPLGPGNHFTVESGPDDAGWFVAQMDEPLYFESKERPGDSLIVWKGKFYVRNDAYFKYVELAKGVTK